MLAIFIGPTLRELAPSKISLERCTFFPPIQRGDLYKLTENYDAVLIVDGYFHSVPAVGHIEIRHALQKRKVFGCASMGAIRAFEMREFGMIGVGAVYNSFLKDPDFTDDEVALLHAPEPFFFPQSEPLVNIRNFLYTIVSRGDISIEVCESVILKFKKLYFGLRTRKRLIEEMSLYLGQDRSLELVSELPLHRIKGLDFLTAVRTIFNEQQDR